MKARNNKDTKEEENYISKEYNKKSSKRLETNSFRENENNNSQNIKKNIKKVLKINSEHKNQNYIKEDFETFNHKEILTEKKSPQKKINQDKVEDIPEIDFEDDEIINFGKPNNLILNVNKNITKKIPLEKSINSNNNISTIIKNEFLDNLKLEKIQNIKNNKNEKKISKEEFYEIQNAVDENSNKNLKNKIKKNFNNNKYDSSDLINLDSTSSTKKKTENYNLKIAEEKKNKNILINQDINNTKITQQENYKLEIFIDTLNLNSIDMDGYGPNFLPYLEILHNNETPERINTYKDLDNSKLDNSMNSNISDLDSSYNLNQSYLNTNKNKDSSKTYQFRYYKSYFINKKILQEESTNLIFYIKNGLKFKKSDNINNSYIPIVTIGSEHINIKKFFKEYQQNIFDGAIQLKLRKHSIVGRLNIIILLSEDLGNLDVTEESLKFDNYIKSRKFDEFDDLLSQKSLKKKINLWKNNFIDSEDLSVDIVTDFFEKKSEKKNGFKFFVTEQNINNYNTGKSKVIEFTGENGMIIKEDILKSFFVNECYNNKNKYALFNLLYILVCYVQYDNYDIVDSFFNFLDDKEINFFVEISIFDEKNIFLYNNYLILINFYIRHHKFNEVNLFLKKN